MIFDVLIPVFVPDCLIEDGSAAPPEVGSRARFWLVFQESAGGPEEWFASDLEATAVSNGEAYYQPDNPRPDCTTGRTVHPVLLHGERWTANWLADRPVEGPVRLRGELYADFRISVPARAHVNGLIRRVTLVTETVDTSDPDQDAWRPDPDLRVLRDVGVSPRWFEAGLANRPLPPGGDAPEGWYVTTTPNPWVHETGVLVDLEV